MTQAQRDALDAVYAARNAEIAYAGRDGGELMRLERATDQAMEAARRLGAPVGDPTWR